MSLNCTSFILFLFSSRFWLKLNFAQIKLMEINHTYTHDRWKQKWKKNRRNYCRKIEWTTHKILNCIKVPIKNCCCCFIVNIAHTSARKCNVKKRIGEKQQDEEMSPMKLQIWLIPATFLPCRKIPALVYRKWFCTIFRRISFKPTIMKIDAQSKRVPLICFIDSRKSQNKKFKSNSSRKICCLTKAIDI